MERDIITVYCLIDEYLKISNNVASFSLSMIVVNATLSPLKMKFGLIK